MSKKPKLKHKGTTRLKSPGRQKGESRRRSATLKERLLDVRVPAGQLAASNIVKHKGRSRNRAMGNVKKRSQGSALANALLGSNSKVIRRKRR